MRAVLVASSGGHLAQLSAVRTHWTDVEVHWVTFRKPDAFKIPPTDQVTWAFHPTTRNIPNALRNLRLAVVLLRRLRPDVVVSDGAGVAVPFFVAARLLRIPTVYLEVFDRVSMPTLTGRICYPLADLFCLQWPEQRLAYRQGRVVGRVY